MVKLSCILVKIVSDHIFIEPVNDLAYSVVSVRDRDRDRTATWRLILFNEIKTGFRTTIGDRPWLEHPNSVQNVMS